MLSRLSETLPTLIDPLIAVLESAYDALSAFLLLSTVVFVSFFNSFLVSVAGKTANASLKLWPD